MVSPAKLVKGSRLRRALNRKNGVFAPGVSSPQSARCMATRHEFLYLGGYAASALRGFPDMGILSATEMVQHIRAISEAVPEAICIADLDDGYGGLAQVRRWIREVFSTTDVAAIHLEDQRFPKRCGHIAGRQVIPAKDFVAKLKVAIETRDEIDPSRLIIARTDALGAVGGGMKEAVQRGRMYSRAGADLVWCETRDQSIDLAKQFALGMRRDMPKFGLAYNLSPSFSWLDRKITPVTMEDLRDLGYAFTFITYLTTKAEILAVWKLACNLASHDPIETLRETEIRCKGTPAESVMKFAGVDDFQQLEMRFDPEAKARIGGSEGFGGRK